MYGTKIPRHEARIIRREMSGLSFLRKTLANQYACRLIFSTISRWLVINLTPGKIDRSVRHSLSALRAYGFPPSRARSRGDEQDVAKNG